MKRKILFSICLSFLSTVNAAKIECPKINFIQSAGFSELYKNSYGYWAASQNSKYNTPQQWNFGMVYIGNSNLLTKTEATKLFKSYFSTGYFSNKSDNGGNISCSYQSSYGYDVIMMASTKVDDVFISNTKL